MYFNNRAINNTTNIFQVKNTLLVGANTYIAINFKKSCCKRLLL